MADANTALTYSWKLNDIKLQNQGALSNVIIHATWEVTGTDANNNSGSHSGALPMNPPNANSFIDFTSPSMSQNTVLGWVQALVQNNAGYWAHINEQIIEQINKIENPIVSMSNPWAPSANANTANTH